MDAGILRMYRGDAAQHYPIKSATWGFSKDNRYSIPVLCFAIETESQESIFTEEDAWSHDPSWRLDVWSRGLNSETLKPGCQFRIPDCNDDFTGIIFTMFFYDEHEGTTNNVITVRRCEGETLVLSIEGYIRHEFASMPPTRIVVDARFSQKMPHEAISAAYVREELPEHEPPYGATHSQNGTV
jgi:hypothetical protein